MTNAPEWAPMLPGVAMPTLGQSHIETAARATIKALEDEQLLQDRDALTVQVVLELARAVGNGLQAGKVSVATATLSKHLLEAIERLPKPEVTTGAGDAFDALSRQLAQAGLGG